MRLLPHRGRGPIGVDIGGRRVRAVQLARTSSGASVAAAAAVPRPEPDAAIDADEAGRLREILARRGFQGREVVLAVPPPALMTGVLELPPRTSGAPIEQIARMEVARMHHRPPEAFEMACWDLPTPARAKKGTSVMVAACGHDDAEACLDLFASAGLEVVALDAEACSLARALSPVLRGSTGIVAVLELGWSAGLLLLLHAGKVVYQRSIPEAGMGRLHGALVEQCGLDDDIADYTLASVGLGAAAEDDPDWRVRADVQGRIETHLRGLIEELRTSLSYAVHQYPDASVDRLLLVGEGAGLPGVDQRLNAVISAEARPVRLGDLAGCPDALDGAAEDTAMAKALGLAGFFEESPCPV